MIDPGRQTETRFSREQPGTEGPQHTARSDFTTLRNALEDGEPLSNIPVFLSQKRRFLRESQDDLQLQLEGRDRTLSQWRIKVSSFFSELATALEPWTGAVKQIEGSYGSGVGSYFRLLRTFLYYNVLVSLITFVFLVLPLVTDSSAMEGGGAGQCEAGDVLLGTGCFTRTLLFYGGAVYSSGLVSGYWPHYNVAKGYIYVTFIGYAVYLLSTMASFVSAYKASFIDNAEMEARKFGSTVFSAWQMTIEDKKSAKELKNKIQEDFHKLLKFKGDNKRKSRSEVAVRVIVFLLVLVIMAGICYGFYELLEWSGSAQTVYIIPIILSSIIVVLPWLLRLLNKVMTLIKVCVNLGLSQVEKYKPTENLYVRMIQTSVLILSLLLLIRVFWYQNKTDDCWETKFGQEMYRLVLFSFLVIIMVNLVIETLWSLVGTPEFDISRNSINIIYFQVSLYYL